MAQDREVAAYVLLASRLDALMIGALCAWAQTMQNRSLKGIGIMCIAAAIVLSSPLLIGLPSISATFAESTGIALSAACVVYAAHGYASRVLAHSAVRFIGTISYGVYVYHAVIPSAPRLLDQRWDIWLRYPAEFGWPRLAWMIATTLPIASVSWFLFERPLNDLKRYLPYVRRSVASDGRDVHDRPTTQRTTVPADAAV
jgi:peptidoglycan/LPS O-acetylase OafA/YrhL